MQQTRCALRRLPRKARDLLLTGTPVSLVQLVKHLECFPMEVLEITQLVLAVRTHRSSQNLTIPETSGRLRGHQRQVPPKSPDLLRLLRQVESSCG